MQQVTAVQATSVGNEAWHPDLCVYCMGLTHKCFIPNWCCDAPHAYPEPQKREPDGEWGEGKGRRDSYKVYFIHTHMYMHTHIYTHIHLYTHSIYMCTNIQHIYIYTHIYLYTHSMYMCTNIQHFVLLLLCTLTAGKTVDRRRQRQGGANVGFGAKGKGVLWIWELQLTCVPEQCHAGRWCKPPGWRQADCQASTTLTHMAGAQCLP